MSRAVKIIAICVVMLLLAGAVTGVAILSANYEPAAEKTGLMVDGELVEDPGTILTIGDSQISFADYRYYYLTYKKSMDSYYGDTIWDTDFDGYYASQLKTQVEKTIQRALALRTLAQEEGIALTDEDKADIAKEIAAQKTTFGEEEFQKRLQDAYFTDEAMYQRISEDQLLQRKAQEKYEEKLAKETGDEIIEDTVFTAKHILIGPTEVTEEDVTVDEDTSAVDSQDTSVPTDTSASDETADPAMAAALKKANELMEQIRNSDDPAATFDELMVEYSEDPGLESNPDGYTFGEGEMIDEFYDTTKSLAVGEISDPVESVYGYHIIMRMPLDEEYVAENRETIISAKTSEMLNDRIDVIINTLKVTPSEYYTYISPSNIR